jgi:hypothetical protein
VGHGRGQNRAKPFECGGHLRSCCRDLVNRHAIRHGAAQLPDRHGRHDQGLAGRRLCPYRANGFDGKVLRRWWGIANAYCNSDSYSHAHSHANCDSDGYAYTDSYANCHSNSYAYTDSYANCDTSSYAYCHSNSNAHTDRYAYRDSNSYAYALAYANCYSNGNSHSDSNTNSYSHTNSYANRNSQRSAEVYSHTATATDTTASAVGRACDECQCLLIGNRRNGDLPTIRLLRDLSRAGGATSR